MYSVYPEPSSTTQRLVRYLMAVVSIGVDHIELILCFLLVVPRRGNESVAVYYFEKQTDRSDLFVMLKIE